MNNIFYKGEDIFVTFTSIVDLSSYAKVVKYFTPFSAIKTATITPVDSYSFKVLFPSADTALLGVGDMNVVLELTDANSLKKIGKTIQVELRDAYTSGNERDNQGVSGEIIFYSTQSIEIVFVSDTAITLAITSHINDTTNPHRVTKSQVGLDLVDNTRDVDKPVSTAQQTELNNRENTGVAASLIDALKDSVPTAGNTLKKLYNMFVAGSGSDIVANIASRDAYNIPSLLFQLFVEDDGDGRWALYSATTIGVGATFVKLSDPDLLNAVMSGSQIAAAYESVSGVNRFTTALKTKLENISSSSPYLVYNNSVPSVDLLDPNLNPSFRAKSNSREIIGVNGSDVLFVDANALYVSDPSGTNVIIAGSASHSFFGPTNHPAFIAGSDYNAIMSPSGSQAFKSTDAESIINSPTGSRALYADASHLLICDENNIGAFYANANVRIFGDGYGATAFQINVDSRRIMTPSGNNAVYADDNGIILYATDQVFAINITDEIMFNLKEEHNSDVIFWGLVEYDNDETHNGYSTFYGGADFQCEADFDSDVYFNGLVNMGSLFVLSPIPNPTGGYDGQIAFTGSAFKGRINGVWKTFQMV